MKKIQPPLVLHLFSLNVLYYLKPDKYTEEKVRLTKGPSLSKTHRGFVQLESCLKVRSESWSAVELPYTVWLCTDLGLQTELLLWFLTLIS